MEIGTIIGLVLSFGALMFAASLEGAGLSGFLKDSAALIVFGGTLGAALTSFPLGQVLKLPTLILKAFLPSNGGLTLLEMVKLFVGLAEKARREGLLSLEEEGSKIKDPFVKKGILLVVDGIDPEVVEGILDSDTSALEQRHQQGYGMLEAMGGYAPTMGIIGTVMGLIQVLSSLEDPSALGSAIAVAFIATLYGVGTANLVWLPLAAKLKSNSKAEVRLRAVAREGVLSVQAGDNPRIVREKLEAYLPAGERGNKAAKENVPESPGARAESPLAAGSLR